MKGNRKIDSRIIRVNEGSQKRDKTGGTIAGSIFVILFAAFFATLCAYMVTVKVNESNITTINSGIEKLHASLNKIEENQIETKILLNSNKNHIESLEKQYINIQNSLRETNNKLNTLILALVHNDKINLDYKLFTSFKTIDDLEIDDLKKLAKEIKKTQKIVNNKNIRPHEKYAVVNKFFLKISDIYKTTEFQENMIARKLFKIKTGVGGGSGVE